jgi:hypothetical protein
MRRVVRPELLDSGEATHDEIQGSLADLRFINSAFGGFGTSKFLLARVFGKTKLGRLAVLEVAAGNGDGSASMQRHFGAKLRCTLLDRKAAHLNGSRQAFPSVVADALSMPFQDSVFDIVTCSLFAHHLEPDELHRFADEALRISRIALLINDIRRSAVHLGLVYLGMPLYRSRITRHDSVASVKRAYTSEEMKNILHRSSARTVEINDKLLYRMGAIAWK